MRVGLLLSAVLWGLVLFTFTGCEVYAKGGVRPVHEHQESQKTNGGGLRCLFVDCAPRSEDNK